MMEALIAFIFLQNVEWWHRRREARIQIETLSPVATHGLLAFRILAGVPATRPD